MEQQNHGIAIRVWMLMLKDSRTDSGPALLFPIPEKWFPPPDLPPPPCGVWDAA